MGTLNIPECMYGSFDIVRKNIGKIAADVLINDPVKIFDALPLLSANDNEGLIVIARRWSTISRDAQYFHVDRLWVELEKRCDRKNDLSGRFMEIVESGLEYPWGIIGVIDSQRFRIVGHARKQLAFIEKAHDHWGDMVSVGSRYSVGSNEGRDIRRIPSLLTYCLARQGAPIDMLSNLETETFDVLFETLPGRAVKKHIEEGKIGEVFSVVSNFHEVVLLSLCEHLVDAGYDKDACAFVRGLDEPDPYGIINDWLQGEGNPDRFVR